VEEAPGFGEGFVAQITTQGTTARLFQRLQAETAGGPLPTVRPGESREEYIARGLAGFDPDAALKADPSLRERADNLPAVQLERILTARNPEHLEVLVEQSEARVEATETLSRAGIGRGLVSAIAASVVDPIDLLVGVATGGISRGTLLARASTGAIGGAVGSAGIEAALSEDDPGRSTTDIIVAGITGGLLGGSFGAALGRSSPAVEERLAAAGKRIMDDEGVTIEDTRWYPRGDPNAVPIGKPIDTIDGEILGRADEVRPIEGTSRALPGPDEPVAPPPPDEPTPPETDSPTQAQSVGAAAAPKAPPPEFFGESFTPPTTFVRLLQAKSVPAPIKSVAAKVISGLPLRNKKATAEPPAEIVKQTLTRQVHAKVYSPPVMAAYRKWAKDTGRSRFGFRAELGNQAWQDFMSEVGRTVRGNPASSPEVSQAADAVRDAFEALYKMGQDVGFPGFVDDPALGFMAIKPNRNYLPRKINLGKFMQLRTRLGGDGVKDLIAGAVRTSNPMMDPGLASRMAAAVYDRADGRVFGFDMDFLNGISEASVERLRYYLPNDPLVDDVIAYLKQFRQEGSVDAGRPGPTRYRIDLDETHQMTLANGETVAFGDLLEDNADALLNRYTDQMTGWFALRRTLGVSNDADLQALYKRISEDLSTAGTPAKDSQEALQRAINLVLGRPIFDFTDAGHTAALAGKYNMSRTLGQALFAQTEIANAIALGGWRGLIGHVPALRSLVRGGAGNPLNDAELNDELRYVLGVGINMRASIGKGGRDDLGEELGSARVLGLFDRDGTDRFLTSAARTTAYVGLMGPMQDYMARYAGRALAHRLGKYAKSGEPIPEWFALRMRQAGLNDARQREVLDAFRQHARVDAKGFVISHNFDAWDADLRFDYQTMANGLIYRAIQHNDIGSGAPWMHHWIGRLFMQLKSFVAHAYVKQTVYDIHNFDSQVAAKWLWGLSIGALFYSSRTYINHGHNPEEYEKRMDPSKVALASVNYLGAASFLPSMVDTAWLAGTTGLPKGDEDSVIQPGQAIFGFGRTSGLAADIVTGNPTVDAANNFTRAVTAPMRAGISDEIAYSQQDLERVRRLIPLGNAAGVARFFDWLGQDVLELPETPKE
jgi:hypothetical protein